MHQQLQRLVGDAILRIIEIDADIFDREAFAPLGVFGEKLAQMGVFYLFVVSAEGGPCGQIAERCIGHPKPLG